ncbi:peptidyl-prolyl cis-trans isomerase [Novimethylophilus kurashikiensis]|uniref:Peptidyl-prolyl cis-trans isomerase n=1 Tax=Novimethylophilus kurashikiensis TaxID=1825523 RepID=A0A2R5FBC4_9PROT|nr:peptidylprolyl isomerase [Novimethylophilus kurashikiensis]GBG14203.1 peptidyl-prolyl cis-trans isomerase [Novimethylophilus kurashikiensis]
MLGYTRALLFVVGLLASFQLLAANPQVEVETNRGNFVVELYPDKAPQTVENFLRYVASGFYSGTIFHRTIQRFVIQGGGLTEKLEAKSTFDPIPNESTNGLSNDYGTLAMARSYGPNTATSQFYINLEDNKFLNFYRQEAGLEGYTVFGKVVRGIDVVKRISESQTTKIGKMEHVPTEAVVISGAHQLDTPVVAETYGPPQPETINKPIQIAKKGKKRG